MIWELDTNNDLIQQVLKENRKSIMDNLLDDVLGATDYIFEQGYLSRQDYNGIEFIDFSIDRVGAFVDLLATKENEVLDIFIEYLAQKKSDKDEGDGSSSSSLSKSVILHEKLKASREKFSPKDVNGNDKIEVKVTKMKSPAVIDSSDFTMTHKGLSEVCRIIVKRNDEKASKNWDKVISNMNGLDNLDVFNLREKLTKMKNAYDADDDDDDNSVLSASALDKIIMETFTLWKERNGPNATFFSLMGIFQESRLIHLADSLLDLKDEIQKAPMKK